MEEVVKLIVEEGITIGILVYLLIKDFNFTKNIDSVLTEIKGCLSVIQSIHFKPSDSSDTSKNG